MHVKSPLYQAWGVCHCTRLVHMRRRQKMEEVPEQKTGGPGASGGMRYSLTANYSSAKYLMVRTIWEV